MMGNSLEIAQRTIIVCSGVPVVMISFTVRITLNGQILILK